MAPGLAKERQGMWARPRGGCRTVETTMALIRKTGQVTPPHLPPSFTPPLPPSPISPPQAAHHSTPTSSLPSSLASCSRPILPSLNPSAFPALSPPLSPALPPPSLPPLLSQPSRYPLRLKHRATLLSSTQSLSYFIHA